MGVLKNHFTKKNFKNPKWWILLAFVLIALCVIIPLAIVGFVLDSLDDGFDFVYRAIDKRLSKLCGNLEDWSNK